MRAKFLFTFFLIVLAGNVSSQQCLSGGCTVFRNKYPTTTFTPTTSWTTQGSMSPGNYTLFNVTSGNTYEWTYCETYGGVSTSWDAQITLFNDNNTSTPLCFSTDQCGKNNDAPYISWTATFTGVARILTTRYSGSGCLTALVSTYNTLAWRQSASGSGSIGTPTLSSPANGTSFNVGSTMNFSWTAVTNATSYDLEFDNGTTYASIVTDIKTNSYSTTALLASVGSHTWRIRAKNGTTVGAWSTTRSYSVAHSLGTPTISSPASGTSFDVGSKMSFSWTAVTNATAYDLEFDTGTAYASTVADINTNSYSTTALLASVGSHTWRIRAKNGTTVGAWSSSSSYSVALSLGTPTISSPASGTSFDVGSTMSFSWTAVTNATAYDLEFDTGTAYASTVADININSYSTSALLANIGSHTWRIRAKNGTIVGTWSSSRTYSVALSLGTPSLSSPTDETSFNVGNTISYTWSTVTYADGYDIIFDSGLNNQYQYHVSTNSYSNLQSSTNVGSHTWKVRATNGATLGSWSSSRSYTVVYPLGSYIDFNQTTLTSFVVVNDVVTLKGTLRDVNGNAIPNYQIIMEDGLQQMSRIGPITDINGNFNCASTAKYAGMSEITFILPNSEKQAVYVNVYKSTTDLSNGLSAFSSINILNDTEKDWCVETIGDNIQRQTILKKGQQVKALATETKRDHFPVSVSTSSGISIPNFLSWSVSANTEGTLRTSLAVGGFFYRGKVYYTSNNDYGFCYAPSFELPIIFKGEVSLCVGSDGVSLGSGFSLADRGVNISIKLYEFTSDIINTNLNSSIKIYPNPTAGKIEISEIEDLGNKLKVNVIDSQGKIIYSSVYDNFGKKINLDLSVFPIGLYLIRLSNNEITFQKKVIKK